MNKKTMTRFIGHARSMGLSALLFSLIAGVLLASRATQAAPQRATTIVRCEPAVLEAFVNTPTSVAIYVQDVEALYGADVRLTFDPAFVTVSDADPTATGVQIQPLNSFLQPDFVLRRVADNTAGTIRYAVTQVAPSPPVSGSGALARIDLIGSQAGSVSVTITAAELARNNGTLIPVSLQDCTWHFYQPWRLYLPVVRVAPPN